ncbi:uncharacterized protein LOC120689767 isoform X2 [Panicum virgatum]|uniref:uncharacterized protein LOC120689767 isoform X2 n=1 Tax=Panicum virgatum TaxID=38727 RepID=UPI0019D5A763|nr:uncharacterized protein LOC120689767 isoform X2 [Panicum virgatum]
MGRLFLTHLDGNVYSCKHCKTHLGLASDIISKAFHCKNGKAYLFHKVKPHMRRARGTRKESIFWRGSRWQAQTEASTGLHMILIWPEVMPTIYEEGLGKLKHVWSSPVNNLGGVGL